MADHLAVGEQVGSRHSCICFFNTQGSFIHYGCTFSPSWIDSSCPDLWQYYPCIYFHAKAASFPIPSFSKFLISLPDHPNFTMAQASACHVRSTSLPSTSHPFVLRFQDGLHNLKASSMCRRSELTFEHLNQQLEGLASLYLCVEDILGMPCSQKAIAAMRREKRVIEEVDGFVRLLDMSSYLRDSIFLIKDQVQGLQSALRTREVDDALSLQKKISAFASALKKAKKEMKCLLKTLRKMEKEVTNNGGDQSLIVGALQEARMVSVGVYRSIFSFLSKLSQAETSRWNFLSRERAEEAEVGVGSSGLDLQEVLISLLAISKKEGDSKMVQGVEKRLRELEGGVCHLEFGLEAFFRHLIRSRVSLLNIANL